MRQLEHKGIKFLYRDDTSDLKTFEEVVIEMSTKRKETRYRKEIIGLIAVVMLGRLLYWLVLKVRKLRFTSLTHSIAR